MGDLRKMYKKSKVVKIRWCKNYSEATSHVGMGEILNETPNYLVLDGYTFHFDKDGHDPMPRKSSRKIRWIPWAQIELVTELPENLNWDNITFFVNEEGRIVYKDYTMSDETALAVSD